MFVKTMMCLLKSKMFRAHIFLLKEEVWHFFTRSWNTKHYDSIICLMSFLCGENENPTLFVDWYDVSLSPEDPLRGYQTVEFWGSRRRMATRPFKCACYREPEVLCARRLQDETKPVEFWWTIPMIFNRRYIFKGYFFHFYISWLVLCDEQMRKGWPFLLRNDQQRVAIGWGLSTSQY